MLEAVGRTRDGKERRQRIESVGSPHAIRLRADRATYAADQRDVAVVTAQIVDAHGHVVPHADHNLQFRLHGNAQIIGLGNGDPNSHEPDQPQRGVGTRRAFHGLAQVLIQTTNQPGNLQIDASAQGLHPATLRLATHPQNTNARPVPIRP